jgi:hypothetical protein
VERIREWEGGASGDGDRVLDLLSGDDNYCFDGARHTDLTSNQKTLTL